MLEPGRGSKWLEVVVAQQWLKNPNWLGLVNGGLHEKRLLTDLLDTYNVLERPVGNESDPLVLSFGLTLMQIIDVVSGDKLPYT